jgi:hypothetical protein
MPGADGRSAISAWRSASFSISEPLSAKYASTWAVVAALRVVCVASIQPISIGLPAGLRTMASCSPST